MIDLDKIFDFPLDPDLASKTKSSSQFDDAAKERGDAFKGILENSLRDELLAKNGKVSPNCNMSDLGTQYRSLGGGTELILVGNEPSNESIQEFAVLQGIDPATIALIIDPSETMGASAGISEVSDLSESKHYISDFIPEGSSQIVWMGRDIQLPSSQLVDDPKINTRSSVEKSFVTAEKLGLFTSTKKTETAQTADLATALKISIQGDNAKKDSILSTTQNKKVTLSNLKAGTTEGVLKNFSLQRVTQKIEMISLGNEIEEVFSQVKPQGVASQIPNFQDVLRGDNSVATNLNLVNGTRLDLSFKPGIEMETNIDHEHLIRRQEQYLHASRRLAAALGERLAAQISKGAWRVEMDLHPKSLGRIEIQLEMRNGDLEAYFNPSQNITRDLLLESFSKLRDVLSEHGIDSAYIGLGSGKKQDSDGKPTEAIATLDDRDESEFDSNTSMATSPDQTITSDGLDIKV
jgi:flagellar hook-length control protein FliK